MDNKKTTKRLVALLAAAGISLAAGQTAQAGNGMSTPQLEGNGNKVTRERDVEKSITGINASKSVTIDIVKSNEPFIKVIGDSNLIPYLRTEVLSNGTLEIEPTSPMNNVPKVTVGSNKIQNVSLAKSCAANLENGYSSDGDVSIDVSQSSNITGFWNAKNMKIRANSSSSVTLRGKVSSLDIQGNRSSTINLMSLRNQGEATVNLGESSRANVSGGTLKTAISNKSSYLNFYGNCRNANIQTEKSSKVNCHGLRSKI